MRSSMPNSPTVSTSPGYAAHRAGAVQGIKPALNGIMYNFDAGGFPKTCRGTMFGLIYTVAQNLRGGVIMHHQPTGRVHEYS